jgi:2-oxoglutarate ferredoxin oxidoreductase subunit alpha
MYERFGDADAQIGILGWGSTIGPVMEAVERAQAEGIKVAVLYIKMVYPLHHALIEKFISKCEAIIVPELNYVGQLARMIQAEFWREVISLRKFGGTPFKTREVYEEIKRVHGELKKSTKKPVARKVIAKKKTAPKKKARR